MGTCSQIQRSSIGGASLLLISMKSFVTSSNASLFSLRMKDSKDS